MSRVLVQDGGQALVLAIIVVSALAISTAALTTYVGSNESAYGRDRQANRAFDIGEAGLQNGIAYLTKYDSALSRAQNDSVGPISYSIDGGTGSFSATKTFDSADGSQPDIWTVTANGTSPDRRITRTVQEQVTASLHTNLPSPAYDYGLYVASTTGCTTMNGNFTANANIWIGNDLCPNGSVKLLSNGDNKYTVYIGGAYQGSNNTGIGASGARFSKATIVKGCFNGNKNPICSDFTHSNVYAVNYSSSNNPITKPTVDADGVYYSGDWMNPVCSTGSYTFDTTSGRSSSPSTVFNLNAATSYNCTVNDGFGRFVGSLAYDAPSAKLTVSGVIFLDGNLHIWSNMSYQGTGVIYVNGTVDSKTDLCARPGIPNGNICTSTWNPAGTGNDLEIVALNSGNASPGWNMSANGQVDVTAFVNGLYDGTGGGTVTGPILADNARMAGGGGLVVPGPPPAGGPGSYTTSSAWTVVPSSWRQCVSDPCPALP